MCEKPSKLYQARALEPVAGFNDVFMLMDQNGPVTKGPFYGVTGIEPVSGLGPHGVFLIWSQGAAPAGYAPLPSAVPQGNIPLAGSVIYPNPPALQLGPSKLLQARFSIEPLALVGGVPQDLDLQILYGAMPRFGVPVQTPGAFNMIDQVSDPADANVAPAQGASETLPAAYAAVHPRDQGNLSEFFVFENNPISFKIVNNAVGAITAGAVGLRIWGYLYVLKPLAQDDTWKSRWLAGAWRLAPSVPDIVTVPIAPAQGATAN